MEDMLEEEECINRKEFQQVIEADINKESQPRSEGTMGFGENDNENGIEYFTGDDESGLQKKMNQLNNYRYISPVTLSLFP